jgi:hypothetical protein
LLLQEIAIKRQQKTGSSHVNSSAGFFGSETGKAVLKEKFTVQILQVKIAFIARYSISLTLF